MVPSAAPGNIAERSGSRGDNPIKNHRLGPITHSVKQTITKAKQFQNNSPEPNATCRQPCAASMMRPGETSRTRVPNRQNANGSNAKHHVRLRDLMVSMYNVRTLTQIGKLEELIAGASKVPGIGVIGAQEHRWHTDSTVPNTGARTESICLFTHRVTVTDQTYLLAELELLYLNTLLPPSQVQTAYRSATSLFTWRAIHVRCCCCLRTKRGCRCYRQRLVLR